VVEQVSGINVENMRAGKRLVNFRIGWMLFEASFAGNAKRRARK